MNENIIDLPVATDEAEAVTGGDYPTPHPVVAVVPELQRDLQPVITAVTPLDGTPTR